MSDVFAAAQQELVSKYQSYTEYKDSEITWLGKIPSHWLTSKLRYMFTFGKGLSITKDNLRDEGIPCVNYGEVHSKYGFEVDPAKHPLRCVEGDYLKTSSSSLLNVGDFVFADTSEDIDGSGNFTQLTNDVVTFAGYHTIIVRPIYKDSHRFFAYLFDSKEFRTAIRHAVKGVKVFSITQAILRGADIWLPSQDERQRIAAFLDYETARIDRLIAQQQRLIELLKEKRQAEISHTVTKGLNPDAPMKDSGVEWLGQVPEHWAIPQIGYLCNVTKLTGFEYTNYWEPDDSGDIIALRGYNIGERILDLEKKTEKISRKLSKKLARSKLHQGDVVMPCTGTLGNAAVIPKSDTFHINQNIAKLTFSDVINPDYACYWVTSNNFRRMIDHNNTSGMQPVLLIGDIRNMRIPVPPSIEQREIVCYLNRETAKFEAVIENGFKLLSLLQERRTALISAAVTGKIDLRGWEPPAEEAAA